MVARHEQALKRGNRAQQADAEGSSTSPFRFWAMEHPRSWMVSIRPIQPTSLSTCADDRMMYFFDRMSFFLEYAIPLASSNFVLTVT